MREFRVAVDLGDKHVGICVAEIGPGGVAVPVWLGVAEIPGGQGDPRSFYAGRRSKRRMRRTLKARKARLREIRHILMEHGVPDQIIEESLALCSRRGWEADAEASAGKGSSLGAGAQKTVRKRQAIKGKEKGEGGGANSGRQDDADKWSLALRRPRAEVVAWIQKELLRIGVPSEAVKKVVDVLTRKPAVRGLNNRLVGACANPECPAHPHNGRAVGRDWTVLWLLSSLLAWLAPKNQARRRDVFLGELAYLGVWPRTSRGAFRTDSRM